MNAARKAVVQHALDVSQIVKDNCVLQRALPDRSPRIYIGDDPEPAKAEPVVGPQGPPGPAGESVDAGEIAESVLKRVGTGGQSWLKPAAITAASLLTGAGLTGAAMHFLSPEQPVIIEPAVQGTDLLLPYLEQSGYHLPADKRGVE